MKYDFTNNSEHLNTLSVMLDTLTQEEAQAAIVAISNVRENANRTSQLKKRDWFNTAILPKLKEFAELNSAILEVNDMNDLIEVDITQESSFFITESCKTMLAVLMLASTIETDKLHLVFDFNCLD